MAALKGYPTNHEEMALLEPYTYISSTPGKEMRTELIESFNLWLKLPSRELAIITKVVKMLHTSSLLIDDIEDDSQLRRGEPVAHKIFGVPATINCANYVYFLALSELSKIPNPKMLTIFTEELLCLHRGQGMELLWRDSLTCPTEGEYIAMVNDKLKRHAVKIMEGTKTFEYCRQQMAIYEEKARAEIRRLGGNVRLEKIMDLLSVPDAAVEGTKDAVPYFVKPQV
ncbi:geranylgeranyl pyrophosphate synthetase [Podila horticola]|nr:geranylgeranyl pyrophosphate synthetase [Podila horticola]